MSGIGDADLVRVRSLNELRAGMTVVTKNCGVCGREHARVLLRPYPAAGVPHDGGARPCPAVRAWEVTGLAHTPGGRFCFCLASAEGRLYRLRDLDDADEEARRRDCDVDDRARAIVRIVDEVTGRGR